MNTKLKHLCILLAILGASCTGSSDRSLDWLEPELGWRSMFDGKTLSGWSVTRFGGEGKVEVREGVILLGFGEFLTGITWEGEIYQEDYEVSLDSMRVSGNDFFCGLTFPVGDSFCSFIVGGWGGSLVGLSSIDGLDASENETTRARRFEEGRWYSITVRVSDGRIRAWIDDEVLVDVAREGAVFSVRPEVRLSRPLGISAWQTRAALRHLRFRKVDPLD